MTSEQRPPVNSGHFFEVPRVYKVWFYINKLISIKNLVSKNDPHLQQQQQQQQQR